MKKYVYVYIFVVVISLMLIKVNNRRMFQVGTTEYALRITNLTDCDEFTNTPLLRNVRLTKSGNTQVINGQFSLENDFCIKLISIKLNRCLNNNYVCEYFQHWNITEVCVFTNMRNSILRPFYDSMTPLNWSKYCPCFKKTLVSLNNATISIKEIMNFYPEAAKYHWQIQARTYDRQNVKQNCLYLTFYITSYNSKVPVSTTPAD